MMSVLQRWWHRARTRAQQRLGFARPDRREARVRLRVVLALAVLVGVSTGCIVAAFAAVFRAPLTGIVFALEVPYTQDLARRALLPALVAASTSYVTFVALLGTGRIFEISGGAAFDLRDLLGGFVVGLLCGALA